MKDLWELFVFFNFYVDLKLFQNGKNLATHDVSHL
jgi:hypothetical protein